MFSSLCETSDSEENSAKRSPDSKVDSEELSALLEYFSEPIETQLLSLSLAFVLLELLVARI